MRKCLEDLWVNQTSYGSTLKFRINKDSFNVWDK